MAVFELLAGAAGAFVVSAYFFAGLALGGFGYGHSGLAGHFQLAGFFLLELAFEGVNGGGGGAGRDGRARAGSDCGREGSVGGAVAVHGELRPEEPSMVWVGWGWEASLGCGQLLGGLDGLAVGSDDLHAEEMAGGVFLEAHHHGFEHVEGFLLVGDQGILLGVAAEADALLEVVHGEEVILPEAVEDGEHDDALVVAHGVRAEDLTPWRRSGRGGG